MDKIDLKSFKLRASQVYSAASLTRMMRSLSKYDDFLKRNGLRPGPESLAKWVDELKLIGMSPNTIRSYAYDVISYFNLMMIEVDSRKLNLVKKMLPPTTRSQVSYLSEDEVAKIIMCCRPIYALLFYTMYAYGRRIGEAMRAVYDLDRGVVSFPILKKRKSEVAEYPLEGLIAGLVKEVSGKRSGVVRGEDIFTMTPRAAGIAFKRACERAGVRASGRALRPHILRHSRATSLRDRGIPLDVIGKVLLKHSRVETTYSFYVGVTRGMIESIPKAEEVLFKASPKSTRAS